MTLQSNFNSSVPARLSGYEFTYRIATLPWIPVSAGNFGFFASYTNQRTTGPGQINFTFFAPELANARINYSKGKFQAAVGANYTARRFAGLLGSATTTNERFGGIANNFRNYVPERTSVDVSMDYKIDNRWSVFANARNVFDAPNSIVDNYNDFSPEYSHMQRWESYGVLINLGVKAEF
jgi:outer membrane receptor protein involved in Fe transport